jgi:type II secretory pathway component PulM
MNGGEALVAILVGFAIFTALVAVYLLFRDPPERD